MTAKATEDIRRFFVCNAVDSAGMSAVVAGDWFERWLAEERREALAPIRELHAKHVNTLHTEPRFVCSHRHCIDDAGDQCAWPCPTIRAIETKEVAPDGR